MKGVSGMNKVEEYIPDSIYSTITECRKYYQSVYDTDIAPYFNKLQEIQAQLSNNKITDEQLEYVLSSLPLDLIDISEYLSRYQIELESLKLAIKSAEVDLRNRLVSDSDVKYKETEIKEIVKASFLVNRQIVVCYETLIERINRQLSYCREFIMGCKKIWDRRRQSESTVPIKEQDYNMVENLPMWDEDNIQKPKQYVK